MGDYGKLFSRIWQDPDFVSLDEAPQRLFLLLFSFPTRNNAGVLPLTIKRWAGCSRDGTVEKVTAALIVLVQRRFIIVDWDTEEVLIRTFIKNDETYRQPNVMKNGLGEALKIASPVLRLTLSGELKRLPNHKNEEQTLQTANALVETLSEGFPSKPQPGGTEGCVVVGYLSTGGEATATAPRNGNGSGNVARASMSITEICGNVEVPPQPPPPDYGPNYADAMAMVATIVGQRHPSKVRGLLCHEATKLLNEGLPHDAMDLTLRRWMTRKLHPSQLPALASDVLKEMNGSQLSTVDEKAMGWQRSKTPEEPPPLEIE